MVKKRLKYIIITDESVDGLMEKVNAAMKHGEIEIKPGLTVSIGNVDTPPFEPLGAPFLFNGEICQAMNR